MQGMVTASKMLSQIMYLCMTIVARGDSILSSSLLNLVELYPAIFTTLIGKSRLQKTTTAAATIVVGLIGCHIYEVFFTDHLFNHVAQVIGYGVPEGLSNQLTGILHSEGHLQLFVPIRTYREFPFSNPFSVILNNTGYLKLVWNIEFFQSGPDCEKFVSSLRVEPYLAAQIIDGFCLDPDNMFPVLIVGEKQAIVFRRPSF